MRLGIISDTHLPKGKRALPERCVELLRGTDAILHAGDLISAEVLDDLRAMGPPVHAIHGNVDGPEVLAVLPPTLELDFDGLRIAMVHDGGPADGRLGRLRRQFPDAAAAVFGHSHLPLHQRSEEGFQIFNPGSPTERRRAPSHTMGIATIRDGAVAFELVELD